MKKSLCSLVALILCFAVGVSYAASYTLPEKMYNQIAIGSGMKGSFHIAVKGDDFASELLKEIADADFSIRGIFSGKDFHYYVFQTDATEQQYGLSEIYRKDGRYYFRSDMVPDTVLAFAGTEEYIKKYLPSNGENPLPVDLIASLLTIQGSETGEHWEPILLRYQNELEMWLADFTVQAETVRMDNGFSALDFFAQTAKIAVPSMFILTAIILFLTRNNVAKHGGFEEPQLLPGNAMQTQMAFVKVDFRTFFYFADFVICLLAVFHVVNYLFMLIFTIAVMLVCNYTLFKKVDYSLLLTFVGFFIFTKTLSTVQAFSDFIQSLLSSPIKTYITGIASSQVISNVPAALLLSGFTQNGAMLLLGVNVGGLGTLIASMASVISFKLYTSSDLVPTGTNPSRENYFAVFSAYNLVLLLILGIIVYIL